MPWLRAAQTHGSFDGWPEVSRTMPLADFLGVLKRRMGAFHRGDMLTARNGRGERPVGVVLSRFDEHRLHAEVLWFAWATPRNKLESAVNWINEMRRHFLFLAATTRSGSPFFRHLMKYGILDCTGKVPGWFGDGETAMLWHSRRP